MIHVELKVLFHLPTTLNQILLHSYLLLYLKLILNCITASTKHVITNSKWIKKGFIRLYIGDCWSSLTWSILLQSGEALIHYKVGQVVLQMGAIITY